MPGFQCGFDLTQCKLVNGFWYSGSRLAIVQWWGVARRSFTTAFTLGTHRWDEDAFAFLSYIHQHMHTARGFVVGAGRVAFCAITNTSSVRWSVTILVQGSASGALLQWVGALRFSCL